jgi:hypothetical protein
MPGLGVEDICHCVVLDSTCDMASWMYISAQVDWDEVGSYSWVKLSCTLIEVKLMPLQTRKPNQIFAPVTSTCILISFIVKIFVLILIILWCWSWAQLNLVDPFNEAVPERLQSGHTQHLHL